MPKQKAAARAVSRKARKGGILPRDQRDDCEHHHDAAPGLAGKLPLKGKKE
jgi:hypothetical protein